MSQPTACRRKALGLPDHIKLLPQSREDADAAQAALFQQSGGRFERSLLNKRQKIITEPILPGAGGSSSRVVAAAAAGGGGGGMSLPGTGVSSSSIPAALAAGGGSRRKSAPSAKEQLQQRVLLAKRRRTNPFD